MEEHTMTPTTRFLDTDGKLLARREGLITVYVGMQVVFISEVPMIVKEANLRVPMESDDDTRLYVIVEPHTTKKPGR